MDNHIKKWIIFDAQILQTPARDRGMGQYVKSLLTSLIKKAEQANIGIIILSSSSKKFKPLPGSRDLFGINFDYKFKTVILPLLIREESKNTKLIMDQNKKILNDWVAKENLEDAVFILGSLFQLEIYPACPDSTYNMAIMYDLIPLLQYKTYEPAMDWNDYLEKFNNLKVIDKVLCISKTTLNETQIYCSIKPDKLALINGGPASFDKSQKPKKTPNKPFLLMPTGNDVRKNNTTAIVAFEKFLKKTKKNYCLVITSYFTNKEKAYLRKLSKNIIITGPINNYELAWYYKNCECVLFPSLYEGLGMPIIEAMQFKKPIAASKIDVFLEISDTAINYFDPNDDNDIADRLVSTLSCEITKETLDIYKDISLEYNWDISATRLLEAIGTKTKSNTKKRKIAMIGPHYSGISAIGKFIFELHSELNSIFDVDYYYELSPADNIVRPDLMGALCNTYPITKLRLSHLKKYEEVIYNIGNSNHHTITAARALTHPGIIILHDLNNINIYKDLLARRLIDQNRYDIEEKMTKAKTNEASFLYSVARRQKGIVVHSNYAKNIIDKLITQNTMVKLAPLPIDTPVYDIPRNNKTFTIGMAGIIAGIKGLEILERIAKDDAFIYDKIVIFGFNFAEPGLLDRMSTLSNVEITINLTDYEFQEKLKKLDVFVNYRVKYQGEASQATLEAMRYGVPVIVRGDFGWYSELPDGSVIKATNEGQVFTELVKIKNNKQYKNQISKVARESTLNNYNSDIYVKNLIKLINPKN